MVRTREKLEPVKDQPQQQTMERSKKLKVSKINRRSILCFVLTLAIAGILLMPVATVSAAYPPATFTQEWPLQLVGASTVNVTQAQFEAMAAAHPASYTDNVGNVWDGVAMWRLAALVDDIDPATFNSAAVNVCTVKETACDNYTSNWGVGSGSILVLSTSSDNNVMVANRYNGNPLPLANPGNSGKPWYPLRAVGSGIGGVGGGKTTGGLIKIELLNLPVTTVGVSPSSQAVANGAPFTVNLAINTNQQVRGWQANVDFDATKMQCTGVTEGGFLKDYATSDNATTGSAVPPTIDNVNGHVTGLNWSIFGGILKGGATGSGTLCTLAFTAKASIDNFASITPSGVVVSDQNGTTIPGGMATGGQVAIGNVPMPDLVVSALSTAKVSDTTYTITYTVTNQGNAAAGACSTSIVIDGGAPIVVACPALAAGISDTETTAAQTLTGSSDTILVTADSTNVVAEGNEGNNTRQITYALVGGQGVVIVNGNIAAKLELTVPGTIDPWNLAVGSNDTTGAMNVKCNTPWQVQVNDQNSNTNGHMTKWLLSNGYEPGVKLTAPLTVGCTTSVDLSGTPQTIVTGVTSGQSGNSGQNCTIGFHQPVLYADPVLAGGYSYHIVVTFIASSTL